MKITADTRISTLIKHNKNAIEAIIGLNDHFKKLRNPILRKVMAPRISITEAAKIGKCEIEDFFAVLLPLGFEIENTQRQESGHGKNIPPIIKDKIEKNLVTELDVRPILETGEDPFNDIMKALEKMPDSSALKVINTFEPIPLIKILEGKGYLYFVEQGGDLVFTYLIKPSSQVQAKEEATGEIVRVSQQEMEKRKNAFASALTELDVREMEMPEPMMKTLEATERIKFGEALFVHHFRIPQYLLPELEKRGLQTLIFQEDEQNVKLLIFY